MAVEGIGARIILVGLEGHDIAQDELRLLEDKKPAGVILFRRNMTGQLADTRALNQELRRLLQVGDSPPVIAVDQEGGRVSRLPEPFPDPGPMMTLASTQGPAYLENLGLVNGACLKELGFNVNFAPVADVLTNPANTAIGDRAFGHQVQTVAECAGAFLRGLESTGVRGCLKHFPGQGAAGADTHLETALIAASRDELLERDVAAFKKLLPSAGMVMISHAVYPELDPDHPASLSPLIIDELLRRRLRYRGLVVSDDVNMKAIHQDSAGWTAALSAMIMAGTDLLLVCRGSDRARLAIEHIDALCAQDSVFRAVAMAAADKVSMARATLL